MLQERESDQTFKVLHRQLEGLCREGGKPSLSAEGFAKIVVAYEPVWAIGTGRTATPAQAEEAQGMIRKELDAFYGGGEKTRILYGGSVKSDNIKALIQQPNVDGALVGGASLSLDSFISIVEGARSEVQEKVP